MRRTALLIALVLLAASPALAGGEADFYGSYASFDQAEEAVGGGIRLGWNFTGGLTADFAITLLGNGKFTPSSGYTGDIDVAPFDVGIKYRFPIGMYIGGGFSYVFFDTQNYDIDDETGYYARIGYESVGESGWGWFVEGVYRDFEVDVGLIVDMSGPGVSGGAALRW